VFIEYLTVNYIFVYFELLFDWFVSFQYMRVLKLTLEKNIFMQFCL